MNGKEKRDEQDWSVFFAPHVTTDDIYRLLLDSDT